MLILTASDVRQVFDTQTAFDAVDKAARRYSAGKTSSPVRTSLQLPAIPAEVLVMPGAVDARLFGVKIWFAFAEPAGSIPQSSALITLLDADLGQEVMMDAGVITDLRTGAMSGLAASRLASSASRTIGLVGTGIQGRSQILALVHALPEISIVNVFSRDANRRVAFAESLQQELCEYDPSRTITVVTSESAESACRGADIVVAATTSKRPVIRDSWLAENVLVCGVGSHASDHAEIEAETVGRAKRVVVDTISGGIDGAGDIAAAISAGLIERDDVVELGDILTETAERSSTPGLSVFKSIGFSAADIVSAQLVARRAVVLGLGTVVDIHR